ncbi:MAG: hypothetical protein ACOX34_00700 [Bacillota bacterium]|nr:hypothetical protein [Candidatus Fermentithermobacillaceae bacterium]
MKKYGNKKLTQVNLVPSTLSKQEFEKVYSLLDVSPLEFDCGMLCASLCCCEYEPGVGMYLLPGEEQMFTMEEPWLTWAFVKASEHSFPPDWKGDVAFVKCNATCPRDKRPVQCRAFPLMPYLTHEGELQVKLDTLSGILICPMIKQADTYPVRPEFYTAVRSAWNILIKDPLIRSDVWHQSRQLDEEESSVWRGLLGW